MDRKSISTFVEKMWDETILPSFKNYVRIPNISPGFDPQWEENKLLLKAAQLISTWAKSLQLKNTTIQILQDPGKSPFIFTEVEASRKGDDRTIMFYSHFDKMPAGEGWDDDKGAYLPLIQNGRFYGRGTADDGYAVFSVFTAIKCCQAHGVPYPRIVILTEGNEETSDSDLKYYFNKLKPLYGNLKLFVCMDAGSEDYNHLWVTTTLRGVLRSNITINTMLKPSTNNLCNGVVPDNYLIMRKIMEGIQNDKGEILIDALKVKEIPQEQLDINKKIADIKGDNFYKQIPLAGTTQPLLHDVYELYLNKTWRPCVVVTGVEGVPDPIESGTKVHPTLSFALSFRTPPSLDNSKIYTSVEEKVKASVPFGAEVTVSTTYLNGWVLGTFSDKLNNILNTASNNFFGNELCFRNEGGSIPFLNFFQETYPGVDIANLGVCNADSFEHGANESLEIAACKKFIMCMAYLISEY
jgi:acetylornithine deacetylase/succinyl-diaminopimelate desuccinylase-like protein